MRILALLALCACESLAPSPQVGRVGVAIATDAGAATARHLLSVGPEHACARTADGHVACWGQLGHPASVTHGSRFYPDENPTTAQVVPGLDHVAGVSAGDAIHCAWTVTGEARCWGYVDTSDDRAPSQIKGVDNVIQIAGGDKMLCALQRDGHIVCWDDPTWQTDSYGQRGTALLYPNHVTQVPDVHDAVEIAVGLDHGCARVKAGAVMCWERGGPVHTVPEATHTISLDGQTNGNQTLFVALQPGGKVVMWGFPTALVAPVLPVDATQIAVGQFDVCVAGREVTCWSPADDHPEARTIPNIAHPIEISVGRNLSCARTAEGHVHCWGLRGRLGDGDASELITATDVIGLSDVTKVVVSDTSTCALTRSGRIACWGTRLGYVSTHQELAPDDLTPVDLGISDALDMTMNVGSVSAKLKSGKILWLGDNDGATKAGFYATPTVVRPRTPRHAQDEVGRRFGKLAGVTDSYSGGFARDSWVCDKIGHELSCLYVHAGRGETDVWPERGFDVIPNAIQAIGFDGDSSMCVLHSDGTIACGNNGSDLQPVPAIDQVVSLETSSTYGMCALQRTGTVMCWPERLRASGRGPNPTAVPGLADAVELAGGHYHGCVRRKTGAVACWGQWSLTGSDQPAIRTTPTTVIGLAM